MGRAEPSWAGEALECVARLAAAYGDPAMSIAVRDDTTSWTFTTGCESPTSGHLADERTLFHIGSVGKHVVAAALLAEMERSASALNDPLVRFLPDLPMEWQRVTVQHALQHTSGIPDYIEHVPDDRGLSNAAVYARIAQLPVGFTPGSAWSYSNTNYRLAGDVLAALRGESFEEAMAAFFREAGLGSAKLDTAPLDTLHHAEPMRRVPSGEWAADPVFFEINVGSADGGVVIDAEDAARWCHGFANPVLLSPAVRVRLREMAVLEDGSSHPYGCGLQLESVQTGRPFVSHSGTVPGFVAYALHACEEKFAVMVMSNGLQRPSSPRQVAQEIAELLRPGLTSFSLPLEASRDAATDRDFARLFRNGAPIDSTTCAGPLRTLLASGFGRPVIDLSPCGPPDLFACVHRAAAGPDVVQRYRIGWGERIEHVCVVTRANGDLMWVTTS